MPIKLAFGVGASGEAATNWIFNALTFFYYNQILGLSGTMTAAAVTIGIASDAITDPLMGSTQIGGARNWEGAIPLCMPPHCRWSSQFTLSSVHRQNTRAGHCLGGLQYSPC